MAPHILVIEDDPRYSGVLVDILHTAGYEVTATASAFGAAGLVRRLRPRAILLDLGLPFRPGTSVLTDLKADPAIADIPVVVLSGMTETLSDERAAQATAILSKPVDMSQLLTAIGNALGA